MSDPILKIAQQGAWLPTELFLKHLSKDRGLLYNKLLKYYGEKGVELLRNATPVDTGKTANSWTYRIEDLPDYTYRLIFENTNVVRGLSVAILIDQGHLSKNGYFIEGYHFIEPAEQEIFKGLADSLWKETIKI